MVNSPVGKQSSLTISGTRTLSSYRFARHGCRFPQALDQRIEGLRLDRFGDVVGKSQCQIALAKAIAGVCRERNDGDWRGPLLLPAYGGGRSEAVQLRHMNIHEHDVEDVPVHLFEGLSPIAGRSHLMTPHIEHYLH